jgi:hypothetical protein
MAVVRDWRASVRTRTGSVRSPFRERVDRATMPSTPLMLLGWLGGTLIAVPVLAALLDWPQAFGDGLAGALFVLPISWTVARHARADATRDRGPKLIAFSIFTIAALVVGVVLAVAEAAWTAIAAFCTAVLFASVVVANYRSKPGGSVSSGSRAHR